MSETPGSESQVGWLSDYLWAKGSLYCTQNLTPLPLAPSLWSGTPAPMSDSITLNCGSHASFQRSVLAAPLSASLFNFS